MIINEIKFLNIHNSAFRELETLFTEKYFNLIDLIKAGEMSDNDLIKFHADILQGITTAEEQIITPFLEQASAEKLAEIFKTETNTCKTV